MTIAELLTKLMDNVIVPMVNDMIKEIKETLPKELPEIELVENVPLKLLENEYKNCIDIVGGYLIRHWATKRIINALKASKSKDDISKEIKTLMVDSYDKESDYLSRMLFKAVRLKLSMEKINQSKPSLRKD